MANIQQQDKLVNERYQSEMNAFKVRQEISQLAFNQAQQVFSQNFDREKAKEMTYEEQMEKITAEAGKLSESLYSTLIPSVKSIRDEVENQGEVLSIS
jgi:hypothetical protein